MKAKTKLLKMVTLVGLTITSAMAGQGEFRFDYHPNFHAKLGTSIYRLNPLQDGTNFQCYDMTGVEIHTDRTNPNGHTLDITSKEVRNSHEYYQYLKVDSEFSGRAGIVDFKGSTNLVHELKFNRNTVTYVVKAEKVFSTESLIHKQIKLNESGKENLKRAAAKGDPEYFFKHCGDHILTSRTKTSQLVVTYQFEASTREKMLEIRQHAEAKFLSMKGSLDIEGKIRSIDRSVQVRIKAFVTGQSEVEGSLAELLRVSPGKLEQVRNKVANSINAMTVDSANPGSFEARAVYDLPEIEDVLERTDFEVNGDISKTLLRLRDRLVSLSNYRDLIDTVFDNYFELELQEDAQEQMQNEYEKIEDRISTFREAGKKCMKTRDVRNCKMPKLFPYQFNLEKIALSAVDTKSAIWKRSSGEVVENGVWHHGRTATLKFNLRNELLVEKMKIYQKDTGRLYKEFGGNSTSVIRNGQYSFDSVSATGRNYQGCILVTTWGNSGASGCSNNDFRRSVGSWMNSNLYSKKYEVAVYYKDGSVKTYELEPQN